MVTDRECTRVSTDPAQPKSNTAPHTLGAFSRHWGCQAPNRFESHLLGAHRHLSDQQEAKSFLTNTALASLWVSGEARSALPGPADTWKRASGSYRRRPGPHPSHSIHLDPFSFSSLHLSVSGKALPLARPCRFGDMETSKLKSLCQRGSVCSDTYPKLPMGRAWITHA